MKVCILAVSALLLISSSGLSAQPALDSLGDPLPEGAIQRLGTLKMRYGSVGGLSYLPDGRGVVLVRGDVHIWDLAAGALKSSTEVSSTALTSVELRADGQMLLLADGGGGVYEWDPARRETVLSWETAQAGLRSARYSPNGTRFLVAGSSPMGYMEYDMHSGDRTAAGVTEFTATRCGAIYGPDETTIIMGGGYDHLLEHRSLATGELLGKWATNYEAKQIRLSPDRSTILVGVESCAEEYNLADYSLLHRYDPVAGEAGRCFAHDFAATRNEAVLGLRTGSIHRYDRATGGEVLRWMAHSGLISAVAVSPDERHVLTFGGGLLVESEMETGRSRLEWHRHGGPVRALAFTPDSERVISGSEDATLRVWDPRSGESLMLIDGATLGVFALAVSPNGNRVAAGCKDGTVREFSLTGGELLRELTGHFGFVRSVAYTADGTRLVSSADDGSVRVWSLDDSAEPLKLTGHLGGVLSVAVSPDDRMLLSGGRDGTVRLWDLTTGQKLMQHDQHRGWVEAIAFAGERKLALSTGRDGRVLQWDLETAEVVSEIDNGGWTYGMVVSADGSTVHCTSSTGVNSWSLLRGERAGQLRGHAAEASELALSPDGTMLVTGSSDTSLLVWDVSSHE